MSVFPRLSQLKSQGNPRNPRPKAALQIPAVGEVLRPHDLDRNSFGILNMKSPIEIVLGFQAMLRERSRDGFCLEAIDGDREMIHDAGRVLVVEGNDGSSRSHADDFVGLVLAQYR